MPGHVVDFEYGEKEKAAGKATLCLKIFTCVLSDLMIDYKYVARHGCLSLWYPERSPDTRIEIIIFSVTEKEWVRFLVFPTLFLCALHSSFLIVIYPIYFNFLKSGKIA